MLFPEGPVQPACLTCLLHDLHIWVEARSPSREGASKWRPHTIQLPSVELGELLPVSRPWPLEHVVPDAATAVPHPIPGHDSMIYNEKDVFALCPLLPAQGS